MEKLQTRDLPTRRQVLQGGAALAGAAALGAPALLQAQANAIRIGTQEVTRWGMTPEHMPIIANFIGRVLLDGESPAVVRDDVIAFRRGFQRLCFVRE